MIGIGLAPRRRAIGWLGAACGILGRLVGTCERTVQHLAEMISVGMVYVRAVAGIAC